MVAITLIDKHTAQKTAATESHLALTGPTVVQVEVRRADVSAIERSGNALVLRLKNGEVLTFDNYFVPAGQPVNDLVLIEDRGALWWLHFGEGSAGWTFAPLDSIEPLLLVDQSEAAWVFLPLLVGAVVASDGGSGGLNIKAQVNETGKIISGTTTPGADVVVRDAHGNVLGQTQTDANGHFELTLPRPLNHNEQVDVVGTDADGNTGTDKVTYIDTLAPEAPGAMTVTDDVVGIVGALQSGGLTNDNRPTFSGDGATPGDVIRLYDNGVLIGTGTVGANGHWTITPETGLNDGAHHFVATAVDPAGNESGPGTPFDLVIDTVPPGAPTIAPSDGSGLNGTAEPGSTVNIDINNDGTVDATAPVDGNGQWTYTPPSPLGDGTVVHVTATDPAGNTGPGADGTVDTNAPPPPPPPPPPPDTTPPAAPAITNADDNVAPGTGLLGSGATTNDNTPRLIGTAEPGSTVHVFQNGTEVGQVTAALNGSWSYTPAALTDGGYSFTATATDAAGNTSPASAPFTLTIDTTAPTATIAITAIADDTGTAGDFVTSDTSLTVSGTLTGALGAGEKAQISIDGGVSWTDLTVAGGAWSYVDGRTLTGGTYVYNVRVVDLAGNVGSTDSQLVSVDTAGNDAPTVVNALASVSEEGLPGGAADTTGVPADTTNLATVNGTMVIADVDGTVTGLAVSGPGGLTSGGVAVTWSGSFVGGTYTLTGMAGAVTVATLTVTTAGAYSFVLNQPLDHPVAGVEDVLGLGFAITATDDGGANGSGTLTIKVEDDMPVAADAAIFGVTAAPITITNSLVESFGADGGHVAQITIDGNTYVYDPVADTVAASGSSALVVSHSFNAGTNELTIETIKGETLVVNMQTGAYTYTATGVPVIPSEANVAPQVFLADTGGLLGIAGANVLGLIDISKQQAFAAVDANNNISKVEIVYDPLLGLGRQLDAASALATELGLQFSVVNETLLGLITKSTLTVEAIGGGAIDTLKLNEFLGTVFIAGGAVSLDLLNTVSITATDTGGLTASASASNLLALNLLGATPPPVIMQGTSGDDAGAGSLTGDGDDNRIYGYAGNDTLAGNAGNDILRGGVGADSLDGGAGNDVVMGGAGADTLVGGTGNDLFRWEKGDQGTAGAPVVDTVNDFVFQPVSGGGDIIDLRNLLQGEGAIGSHPGNLSNYLHFEVVGGNTVLSISSTGGFLGGYNAGAVDQQIVFNGVDLVGSLTTDEAVIAYLLSHGNLMVDPATADTNLLAGTTTVNAVVVDNDGDAATTSASFDSSGATPPTVDPNNVAPVVQANTTALLGIVSADALNILGLDQQDLVAADANGNLKSVVVAYQPLLSVNLSPLQLAASSQLADELGLKITVVNDLGLLGLVAPSSVLTITALDGGAIDNLAVNELLATVHFDDAFNLLGVDVRLAVLDATTITATDSAGLTASASLGALLNANALNTLQGSATLIEGGAGNDTLTGGAENERLYGHDGDDVIAGNGGDDLIRGGAGNDSLDGGDGHDLLIDGNGADTINSGAGNDLILIAGTGWSSIDGGAGVDILRLDSGTGLLMNLDGSDGLANLERIDLGIGNAGHSLTLTEAGVLDATDINHVLQITGDASDTVTMNGATFVAQTVVDGITFDQYTFGTATVLVEDPVMVVV